MRTHRTQHLTLRFFALTAASAVAATAGAALAASPNVPTTQHGLPVGALTQLSGAQGCLSSGHRSGCRRARALAGAAGVALSPDGRSVYVASFRTNAVTTFMRDPKTGALHQPAASAACVSESGQDGCASGRGLVGPFAVAVSSDGANVYVASYRGVAEFARNRRTGALTELSSTAACIADGGSDGCTPGRGLIGAASIAVSPDGLSVYVASPDSGSGAVAVLQRDPTTGALSQLAGLPGCTNEDGAEGCQLGNALSGAFSVGLSPDGKYAYVGSGNSNAVVTFARDPIDGELSQIPAPGECTSEGGSQGCATGRGMAGVNGVTVSPDGGYVYVAASGSSAVAALFRTRTTGGIDQLPGQAGCVSEGGREHCASGRGLVGSGPLALSPAGDTLYVAGIDSLAVLARDRGSGQLVQLSGVRGCFTARRAQEQCTAARAIAGATSVAVSPDGRSVYVASFADGSVAVFARTTPCRCRRTH